MSDTPWKEPTTYLHPLQGLGLAAGAADKVHMLHVLCDPLQETQGLVEGDGHGDLGQLLQGAGETRHRGLTCTLPGAQGRCLPYSSTEGN